MSLGSRQYVESTDRLDWGTWGFTSNEVTLADIRRGVGRVIAALVIFALIVGLVLA